MQIGPDRRHSAKQFEVGVGQIGFLFQWDGRIRGGQLLVWSFGVGFFSTLASMALVWAFIPRDPVSGGWPADSRFWLVWSLGQLPGWVAAASLVARRLHDLGHSARCIIPSLAYIGAIQLVALNWPLMLNNTWLGLALGLPILAVLIWLIAAPGEPRHNRFGPVPRA